MYIESNIEFKGESGDSNVHIMNAFASLEKKEFLGGYKVRLRDVPLSLYTTKYKSLDVGNS